MPTSLGGITLLAAGGMGLAISFVLTRRQQGVQDKQPRAITTRPLVVGGGGGGARLLPRTATVIKTDDRGTAYKLVTFKVDTSEDDTPTVTPLSYITLTGLVSGQNESIDPRYVFGRAVERPYVPLLDAKQAQDHFEILVKKYPLRLDENDTNGITSHFIHTLVRGDQVQITGPVPQLTPVVANELFKGKKHIVFVAAGTGITPFLQLIEFADPDCTYTLVWSNQTEEDAALCKRELDKWTRQNPERFKAHLTFTRKLETLKDSTGVKKGRVSINMLRKSLPSPASDVLVFVCGPDSFVHAIGGGVRVSGEGKNTSSWVGNVGGLLKELGYDDTMVVRL